MCFSPGGHWIFTSIYFICFGRLHPSIQLPIQQLPSSNNFPPVQSLGMASFQPWKASFIRQKSSNPSVPVVQNLQVLKAGRAARQPSLNNRGVGGRIQGVGYCCNDLVGCFQPIRKIWSSNWIISPSMGENKKYLKPPPNWFLFDYVLNEKASWKCRRRCEKTLWKTNMAGQCASFQRFPPKGISNQLAVFFIQIPYSCSTKMRTQVLKELLCPPTREPPPKHIWDMAVLSRSAHIFPLCQSGASCPPYTSALWHLKSSSFELKDFDVFLWNGLNGGRFGFGATGEKWSDSSTIVK